MIEPESQISLLVSEPISVDVHVEKLDGIRLKSHLRPNERRQGLRSFFALRKDSPEITPGMSINARTKTAKLYALAKDTVSRIVTN